MTNLGISNGGIKMKEKKMFGVKTASLLLMALVFAFAFTSCDGGGGGGGGQTPLQGTWVSSNGYETVIITGNQFEYTDNYGFGVKGTFSTNTRDSTITMNFNQFLVNGNWISRNQVQRDYGQEMPASDSGYYFLDGETLSVYCENIQGTYYRVPGTGPKTPGGGDDGIDPGGGSSNNFVGTWSDGDLTVVCTASTWTASYYGDLVDTGTYTPTGNSATFTSYGGYTFGTASVSGNTMTVRVSGEGTFTLTKVTGGTPVGPSVPGTPTNVSASAQSSSSIRITWNAPSSGGTPIAYYIYQSTSSTGTYSIIATTSSTSYTDTGLNSLTTYYYKVAAVNNAGNGPQSSYTYATTSSSGGNPVGPGTTIDLTSSTWYSNTMTYGATHYYRFYANSGNLYYVEWEDTDNSNYTADIKVGLRREGSSSYVAEVADRAGTNEFYFSVTSANAGYYIIEVQGLDSSSTGTYRVRYY
jgi:hypothetical protein